MAARQHRIDTGSNGIAASGVSIATPSHDAAPSPALELQALLAERAGVPPVVAGSRREQLIFIAAASAVLWGSIGAAALLFAFAI